MPTRTFTTDDLRAEPARYRALPAEVEALQWTGTNAAAMTNFAAERFAETAPEDRTADPDSTAALLESDHNTWFDLHVGDWVVRRPGGWFGVLDDDEFTDRYEELEPEEGERGDSDSDLFDLISEIASRLRDATDEGEYHAVGLIYDLANGMTTVAEARAEFAELTLRHV
ncbi:hypothetical protein ACIG63_27105 [Streptomyces antimycoticus]|uniref:hypothetical protein n=1 Tax=Streptomyces antimycoticus TaxID=68175 RepID=UPI0037D18BB2